MRALYFRRFRLWLPVLDPGCGPVVFVVTSIFRLRGQQSGGRDVLVEADWVVARVGIAAGFALEATVVSACHGQLLY
jgi:hypothetical protein